MERNVTVAAWSVKYPEQFIDGNPNGLAVLFKDDETGEILRSISVEDDSIIIDEDGIQTEALVGDEIVSVSLPTAFIHTADIPGALGTTRVIYASGIDAANVLGNQIDPNLVVRDGAPS